LRRSTQNSTTAGERIILGDVELEESARIARCGNRELELTSLEFDILAIFLKRPGQVVTREELVKTLLGRELAPLDRSIDVHISNLRKKLGPYADGANRIRNIRRVGYIYAIPGMLKEE
jgi:two-component system response regulator CpxR